MKKNIIPIIILAIIAIFVIWFFVAFLTSSKPDTFRPVSGEIDEIQTVKNACRAYCNAAKVAIVSENEFTQSNYCARQFTIDNKTSNCWQPPANIECSFIIEENGQQRAITSSSCKENKESQSYVACGCGCCIGTDGQETVKEQCLYNSKGDDINKIIEEDEKVRESGCELVGCSLGTRYKYCD